jgi:hypothetical protein
MNLPTAPRDRTGMTKAGLAVNERRRLVMLGVGFFVLLGILVSTWMQARSGGAARRPSGSPSTKQKSHRLAQRRIRGGSTVTPSGSSRGRSIANSISAPSGCRNASENSSSAVRNSQSRKSSSSRPLTVSSSVPVLRPSSSAMDPGWTAVTLIISAGESGGRKIRYIAEKSRVRPRHLISYRRDLRRVGTVTFGPRDHANE